MATKVTVYQIPQHRRSMYIGAAMCEGISRIGDHAKLVSADHFGRPDAAAAVFYGYDSRMRRIFDAYRAEGLPVVNIDLGYWGRKEGGPLVGYHKLAVNDRHPTAYFMNRKHDGSRIARFKLSAAPWSTGGSKIILAGMSGKGAQAEGFEPEQWERDAVEQIHAVTDRPIYYRPKPSWDEATPIPGTVFSPKRHDLVALLGDCHAVVTHHSNVAVEAITAGIPAFCFEGVAAPMALSDLSMIESPTRPEGREQWLSDIGWTQFSVAEMRSGMPWRHLKNEGLIP